MSNLEKKTRDFGQEIKDMNMKLTKLFKLLHSTSTSASSAVEDQEQRVASTNGTPHEVVSNKQHNKSSTRTVSSKSLNSSNFSQSPSSYLLEISDDSAIINNIAPEIDAEYHSSDDESDASAQKPMIRSPLATRRDGFSPHSALPSPANSQYFTPPGTAMSQSGNSLDPFEVDAPHTSIRKISGKLNLDKVEVKSAAPTSKFLSTDVLLVAIEKSHLFDHAIQEILSLVHPYDAQMQYRASALGLLRKQIRSTLSVNAFDVSLHEVRCFLPDDPIKLSVIVSKSHMAVWHSSLVDHFTLLAERATLSGGNYAQIYPDDDAVNIGFGGNVEEYRPICSHIISNVSPATNNANTKVSFNVDTLDVEICANNRNDICMLAFIEEFANLVGLDNLFKRSVLLIRAWWNYETASYVGALIKHYLADVPQCIMICAIFNQYHAQIKSPFQALCYFLIEYAEYDGATQAITLQGIAPLSQQGTNQVLLTFPQANHLVSQQMVLKYWQVFNANQNGENPLMPVRNSSSSEDQNANASALYASVSEHGTGHSSSSSCGNASDFSGVLKSPKLSFRRSNSNGNMNGSNQNLPNNKTNPTAIRFERNGFNIVHPFNYSNMITEKLSHRRVTKISKAFQIGAANLSVAIKQSMESKATSEKVADSIRKYFPAITARFSDLWRPDAIGNIVKATSAERLKLNIHFFLG